MPLPVRATHVSKPDIFTADSLCKIALKSKREFYMAEVVFARICAGALPFMEFAEQAQDTQEFNEG